MRTVTLVLNSIVIVFFLGFLTYTFFARQHLNGLARGFVTEKTIELSKPLVQIAEKSLKSPAVRSLLSDDQVDAIRREIAEYHVDPVAYIADLTRKHLRDLPAKPANPLLAKVAAMKVKIRTFYDDTLNALVEDLRIFAASNLVAGVIAFVLAYRASAIRPLATCVSFLMVIAVLYCSYLYIDGMTFFRILFRTHMGWWYPVLLCAVNAALYLDIGRKLEAKVANGS